jgi:uncharacterized protein with predicted RNA binding PUA domain
LGNRKLDLQKIRAIANYQFEHDVGGILFPDGVELTYSKRTGRLRHIYYKGKLLATLRPRDGLFSLTIYGAEQLRTLLEPLRYRVIVEQGVEDFIREGRSVFACHVVGADEEIRPGNEVLVTSGEDTLLAVGKAVLSGREMLAFKRGVAVKVRRGRGEEGV